MERYITVKRKELQNFTFEVGKLLCLKKDAYSEEISAWVPSSGKVGVVANTTTDMVAGTYSGARIYDYFADTFYGKIMFAEGEKAVVKLIAEENQPQIQLFDLAALRQKQGH